MSNLTPVWTDDVTVIAATDVPIGTSLQGTLDARSLHGAKIFVRIGRGGTTILSNGIAVLIRALLNNGAAGGEHPASVIPRRGLYAVAASTTVSVNSNSGQAVLTVASVVGFAADDIICIRDGDSGTDRLEFQRIGKVESPYTITLDRNLGFSHTAAQADTVRNKADVYPPIWLPGGSLYEVIIDYLGQTTGDTIIAQVMAQTYDSELLA